LVNGEGFVKMKFIFESSKLYTCITYIINLGMKIGSPLIESSFNYKISYGL